MKTQRTSRIFALALPLLAGAAVSVSAQARYDNNNSRFDSRNSASRGVVERIYSNSEFDIRADNGFLLRVKTDSYLNLRRGDYVTMRGDLRGNTFYAQSVNRRDDNFPGNGFPGGGFPGNNFPGNGGPRDNFPGNGFPTRNNINLVGEVVEIEGPQQLRVRDYQGRVFFVRTSTRIPRTISRGDQVRVQGYFDGTYLRANQDNVRLLDYDNVNNGYNPRSSRVSFPATIRSFNNRQLVVQGDNGVNYTVLATNTTFNGLRPGDRVRVEGTTRNRVIEATRVSYLR